MRPWSVCFFCNTYCETLNQQVENSILPRSTIHVDGFGTNTKARLPEPSTIGKYIVVAQRGSRANHPGNPSNSIFITRAVPCSNTSIFP